MKIKKPERRYLFLLGPCTLRIAKSTLISLIPPNVRALDIGEMNKSLISLRN